MIHKNPWGGMMNFVRAEAASLESKPLSIAGPRDKRTSVSMKRGLDIAGSSLGIVILSPLFLAVGLIVKLTSRGPVLFKQERVGYLGKTFVFYKFRTMEVSQSFNIHFTFVKDFISGKGCARKDGGDAPVYKIVNDPRVTRFGRFLRRSSLDELPQLFNVLKGEMSLVGPRPPIPYEWDMYQEWHRLRLIEAKPGITGLWQILGRSSTTFDEMVRLDLKYARTRTFALDVKLIFLTLWRVATAKGAY